jgi:uncharacterized protein
MTRPGTQEVGSMAKFQVFRRADGQYRWRLKSANGRIIATAEEGFKRKSGAKHGIDAVKRDAARARIEDTTNPNAATTRSAAPVDESTGLETLMTYLQIAAGGEYGEAWTMFTELYQGLGDEGDGGAGAGSPSGDVVDELIDPDAAPASGVPEASIQS